MRDKCINIVTLGKGGSVIANIHTPPRIRIGKEACHAQEYDPPIIVVLADFNLKLI